MLFKKKNLVIGLTVSDVAYLCVSVPALARLRRCFTLVIYNDCADCKISRRMVRDHGYRGRLHIINGAHSIGVLASRIEIVNYVRRHKIRSDWFMFIRDANIVTGVSMPCVMQNNFAIIQNQITLRSGFIDALHLMCNSDTYQVDDTKTFLLRPYLGVSGTWVRSGVLYRTLDILHSILDKVYDIDVSLSYPAPVDMMMWSALNIVARDFNAEYTPIYMDNVACVNIDLDSVSGVTGARIARALSRYDNLVRLALDAEKNEQK